MTENQSTTQEGRQQQSASGTERFEEATGIVKWFDPRKGFGFIIGPDGQDIFVHFTVIDGDGFRVLKDGSNVHYDAEKNDKGWRATKVHRRAEADSEPEQEQDAPEVVVPRRTYSRTPRR